MDYYESTSGKVQGTLDAVLGALTAIRAVDDGINGNAIAMTGEAVGVLGLGYESYNNFSSGWPKGWGYFVFAAGMGVSGFEHFMNGAQNPNNFFKGCIDFSLAGLTLGKYIVSRKVKRVVEKINDSVAQSMRDYPEIYN